LTKRATTTATTATTATPKSKTPRPKKTVRVLFGEGDGGLRGDGLDDDGVRTGEESDGHGDVGGGENGDDGDGVVVGVDTVLTHVADGVCATPREVCWVLRQLVSLDGVAQRACLRTCALSVATVDLEEEDDDDEEEKDEDDDGEEEKDEEEAEEDGEEGGSKSGRGGGHSDKLGVEAVGGHTGGGAGGDNESGERGGSTQQRRGGIMSPPPSVVPSQTTTRRHRSFSSIAGPLFSGAVMSPLQLPLRDYVDGGSTTLSTAWHGIHGHDDGGDTTV
jgi:hypothetical protein